MIIHEKKTIFIHIPKTAGSSIETYCQCNFGVHTIWGKRHKNIEEYKKNFFKEYNSYRKFTVVRNPYDRIISWYFFLKQTIDIELDIKKKIKMENDFVNTVEDWIKDPYGNKFTCKRVKKKHYILDTQCSFIDETVDILKFENLNKELNKFFNKEIKLPTINKSNHKHYLKYYNQETLDIVYERYKEDFERLNYKKL